MNSWLRVLTGFVAGAAVVAALWLAQNEDGAPVAAPGRKVLYYRNPMGESDTSPVPRKDSMGMEYIPVYADEAVSAFRGNVVLDSTVLHNLGVRTAPVTRTPLASELATVGFVQFDESRITHVHVRAEGWIRELHAHTVGEKVTLGHTLFTLYSPQLLSAQGEYIAALRGGNRAVIAAAEQRLALLDVPAAVIAGLRERREPLQAVPIVAARGGYLSQLQVREGMYVTPELEVMTLGDLANVWVVAEVFESQLGLIAVGDAVTITARSFPGREWRGAVDFVYPMLDSATRTARVRIVVANTDETLKPNMAVDLALELASGRAVLSIPRDALIRGGKGDRAVQRYADGSFRAVPVHAGREFGDRVEVLHGLAEGDTVVTAAQFLIDSESSIKAELERMSPPDDDAQATPHAEEAPHVH